MIPLFNLTRQYKGIREEVLNAVDRVISSGRVILGENVKEFEKELASFVGTKYSVGVSSGTAGLLLSLLALGIKEGDVVLTTPYTFIASASVAAMLRAVPLFVDVDENTMNMDLDKLERVLQGEEGGVNPERVKAIVAVHIFGRSLDLERLEKIREKYGVKIVEDVAQALGAEWKYSNGEVKKAGSIGDISAFSFFPTKNLGAYGDAGAVLTNDEELYEKLKMLRAHGSKVKYEHEILGINARLDEVHAAILRIKLKHLGEWNSRRIEIAKKYKELFEDMNLTEYLIYPEPVDGYNGHVFHQYVVRFKDESYREKVINKFKEEGIGYAIYYPKPLHLQKVFYYLGYVEGDFPVAEKLSKTTLALPIFPELMDEEIEKVVKTIKKALEG